MGKMLLLSFENSENDVISEILSILENKQMKICENRNIKKCLEFQGLTINAEKRLAVKGNKEIEFTFTEFEILLLLAQNAGMVFSKEKIYNIVWKEPYFGDYNIVMSHIRNLRGKIEDNPSKPIHIHVETVVLLSQQKPDDTIEIDLDLDELDAISAELKATYQGIKDYVLKEFGLKVSSLYISQVKRKCGIEVGENYNLPKLENARVPQCPKEKEEAIKAALKYFAMI